MHLSNPPIRPVRSPQIRDASERVTILLEEYRQVYSLALFRLNALDQRVPIIVGTLTAMLGSIGALPREVQIVLLVALASFPYVRLLPKPSPRDRFLTEEEVQRLLAACDEPHLRRFVLLALHTLQRPSAILNLRIEQVDLVWNRINFLSAGGVQSNKRKPIVPITSTLRPELERALKESVTGFVVEFGGNALKKVRRSFRTACKRAGIRNATPGVLRHTGATLLAAAGVPLREVSGMLGHTTSRITEEVYAKRRPEFLAEAARTLDRLFPADTSPTGSA